MKAKILYGVCGIGSGHTFRQLPIIEHFAATSRIVIFAYGTSEEFYRRRFRGMKNVTVVPVAVPFYVGDRNGLDFRATARKNAGKDFFAANAAAMARAESLLGTPDVVVSDYEPISARYAYATGAPIVTVDQQSKYLVGDFPKTLGGQFFRDEIARLRMFFPRAAARFACSFFRVPTRRGAEEDVRIVAPVLREEMLGLKRRKTKAPSILVYRSSERDLGLSNAALVRLCRALPAACFHIFARDVRTSRIGNVDLHPHDQRAFLSAMGECSGIISTAGHSLLSEAMHLGIPVYAVPVGPYEQQMNARAIGENGFGLAHPRLEASMLRSFIKRLPEFSNAIARDHRVLLRGSGQQEIVARLERLIARRKPR